VVSLWLSSFLLGLSLAAPVGPITAAQLDKGMRYGFMHAWVFGLGSFVADVLYMMLIFFGVVHFLEAPIVKTFLWCFGFFVLLYTGIEILWNARATNLSTRSRHDKTLWSSSFSGFLMSLSNPLTLLFWIGIYGSVLAQTADQYGTSQMLMSSLAMFGGILMWDILMAFMGSSARRFLTPGLFFIISCCSALFMIGFACYFGLKAFDTLF
jgi:L-lysine exporter family protein LysE/ArgO